MVFAVLLMKKLQQIELELELVELKKEISNSKDIFKIRKRKKKQLTVGTLGDAFWDSPNFDLFISSLLEVVACDKNAEGGGGGGGFVLICPFGC